MRTFRILIGFWITIFFLFRGWSRCLSRESLVPSHLF